MNPKVTVLILSYNGKELLKDSVSSYLANDYPNFEVAVVDNGSVDGTKEFVEKEFPKAKVVRIDKQKEEVVVSLLGAVVPLPVTVKIDNVKVIRRDEHEEE